MNPRAAFNDLLPFQGSPFGSLGTSPNLPYLLSSSDIHLCRSQRQVILYLVYFILSSTFLTFLKSFYFVLNKRREWDSNPRALADKRFSRPPRYDHFDISPYNVFQHFLCCFVSACCILSSNIPPVNNKFDIFSKIGHIASISAICPYLLGFSPGSTLCFPSKMPPQPPDLPAL